MMFNWVFGILAYVALAVVVAAMTAPWLRKQRKEDNLPIDEDFDE